MVDRLSELVAQDAYRGDYPDWVRPSHEAEGPPTLWQMGQMAASGEVLPQRADPRTPIGSLAEMGKVTPGGVIGRMGSLLTESLPAGVERAANYYRTTPNYRMGAANPQPARTEEELFREDDLARRRLLGGIEGGFYTVFDPLGVRRSVGAGVGALGSGAGGKIVQPEIPGVRFGKPDILRPSNQNLTHAEETAAARAQFIREYDALAAQRAARREAEDAAALRDRLRVVQPEPIRAYHSSPHDFERFDLSKIGTGEGAQVYGHGLYFAENPAVSGRGGEYWKQFANRGTSGENTAVEFLARAGFDREKAAQTLRDLLANPPAYTSGYNKMTQERMRQEALQLLESDKHIGPRTYEVAIRARPEQFLDWDRPPSQQPGTIMDVLYPGQNPAELDLGDIHNVLRTGERVSKDLNEAGIPGIRYLDQGSRQHAANIANAENALRARTTFAGSPQHDEWLKELARLKQTPVTYNYVVFDPNRIDILRKYGIAGVPAAGTMGALASQEQYQ